MDRALLALLERAFAHHAGGDAAIDAGDLQKALGTRSPYLAKRVLAAFDTNGDGVVSKDEFLEGVRALVLGSDRDKLRFAFRLHDDDGDDALSRDEVMRMIVIALAESETLERRSQPADQLVDAVFSVADHDRDGRITFEELESAMSRRPHLLWKLTRNEAIWIAPNEELLAVIDEDALRRRGAFTAADRSRAPAVVLVLFALVNVALFVVTLSLGLSKGAQPAMQIGRALAKCLDFSGALVLVPMMRRLLTRVRAGAAGRVVPVDDAIDFHKIVGHTLFGLAIAHAAAFLIAMASGHPNAFAQNLFGTLIGLTGLALLVVFVVMWIFALPFIRRGRRFELFYFTHLLYVVWLALAIAHAPQFLFWAGVPLLGFVVEQILRLRRRRPAATIVACEPLRSGVTRVEIERPPGFDFSAGDYVFLRIPQIARHEWHPFTLSSAPERKNLVVHVRSLGNWTSALRRRVDEGNAGALTAFVDGPYGSPTGHIFASKHAVLIGAGIGVTPFASVLESLVLRANGESSRASKLEHAHFVWINRDAYSFEWFAALLREIERVDRKGMLEVHLCMTGARSGAASLGLELARDVMHGVGRSDVFTGFRTHTHVGPPDWEAMLTTFAGLHKPDPVDVFFCGPPGLAAKLRPLCARLGMSFREERF
jgi:predicted ferric reductase/Ca2+-binding EF-hand superfamily protein